MMNVYDEKGLGCNPTSYAAAYAQRHAHITIAPEEMVPVTLSVDRLLAEHTSPITRMVHSGLVPEGDTYTLTIYLNGEVYATYADQSATNGLSHTMTMEGVSGTVYAICHYAHAYGDTAQALSLSTHLAGTLSAQLAPQDVSVAQGDAISWKLQLSHTAGAAAVEYTVTCDDEIIHQGTPCTDTTLRLPAKKSGSYTAKAKGPTFWGELSRWKTFLLLPLLTAPSCFATT